MLDHTQPLDPELHGGASRAALLQLVKPATQAGAPRQWLPSEPPTLEQVGLSVYLSVQMQMTCVPMPGHAAMLSLLVELACTLPWPTWARDSMLTISSAACSRT